jgi:hypothetical protein
MKRDPVIATSGVLDNEEDFVKDMGEISLGEARAVMCVHMLCYVLDGSVGRNEYVLWKRLLEKVRRSQPAFDSSTYRLSKS